MSRLIAITTDSLSDKGRSRFFGSNEVRCRISDGGGNLDTRKTCCPGQLVLAVAQGVYCKGVGLDCLVLQERWSILNNEHQLNGFQWGNYVLWKFEDPIDVGSMVRLSRMKPNLTDRQGWGISDSWLPRIAPRPQFIGAEHRQAGTTVQVEENGVTS
ncbi:uncharacterized protein BT62DRAFT_922981 [Guyanagaster necrorhizus]|uniref:Uncharacterized protein n=1 Tax=Guyanagaster necrorhizus TaxID=856835 RepID=A0A9P8ANL1_9AGAR|nr:uncharacterized protein BT62DRAFT_922981 [Guyanagaster necrorhizus MCA 3950]KAG7441964.1 hypothetical protein BT62DRAFT_922981 [Guyanagaster necrorhizus MCA 3950]